MSLGDQETLAQIREKHPYAPVFGIALFQALMRPGRAASTESATKEEADADTQMKNALTESGENSMSLAARLLHILSK
ncbi:MAG: hypothetical protein AUK08_00695 [Candidatus Pacebacteria bacterium CG2_30_36_39]|nr:MAG: hypothetical protein AUK08_00695 [Candidatus Pacebacteria bacterium CG2_30_36_39]